MNPVDILVIGGGGAALAAAAEAAALGRRVLLIEKCDTLGGTTRLSVGSMMAACTAMQRKAGVEDSPQQHELELLEILEREHRSDNEALRRLLVEHSGDTVNFMEAIGVDFIGPLLQPPFRTRRFYQALPGGRAYVHRLVKHCRGLGVEFRLNTRATQLVKQDGRVTGVAVDTPAGKEVLSARCGVILANGDFSADIVMRRELFGAEEVALPPLNPHSTGDGQHMGIEAGGHLVVRPDLSSTGMARFAAPANPGLVDRLPPWRIVTRSMKWAFENLPGWLVRPFILKAAMTALAPERALYGAGAIIVNRQGERFADEMTAFAPALARQPGAEGYVVFDARVARQFNAWPNYVSTAPGIAFAYVDDYRRARRDIVHREASLEALARRIGVPADALRRSLMERNGGSAGEPPYVAMGPLKPWLLLTLVGLAVDTQLRVLDQQDRPIPGLYAVGGVGMGGFSSLYHGHSLGWAFTSGRLAGRAAAFALPGKAP